VHYRTLPSKRIRVTNFKRPHPQPTTSQVKQLHLTPTITEQTSCFRLASKPLIKNCPAENIDTLEKAKTVGTSKPNIKPLLKKLGITETAAAEKVSE